MMPEDVFKALCRLMTDYTYAVDARRDPENVVALFTPDAVLDFSDIDFPKMEGREAILAFYTGLVENMSHEFHMAGNFRRDFWDGNVAAITAYVIGMGRTNDGTAIDAKVRYRMECIEVDGAWKCRHFSLKGMMPMAA